MAGSAYSSDADLNLDDQRLIELTDNAGAQGVKNQTLIDALGVDAQGLIDGKLYGKYPVPYLPGSVPVAIRYLHADLVRYLLFKHRDVIDIPKGIVDDYKAAMAELDAYASDDKLLPGQLVLGQTGASPGGVFSSDAGDTLVAAHRIFGRYRDTLG